MTQAQTSTSSVIALSVDAATLRRCVDLLRTDESTAVLLRLQQAEAQARGYGHLQLITHTNGWWEHNGVAVRCEPDIGTPRSIVVSLHELVGSMSEASWAFGGTAVRVMWYPTGMQVQGRDIAARAEGEVPPLPQLGTRIDRLAIPPGAFEGLDAETQLGRVRLSTPLVGHLVRRGVSAAELSDVDGQPWLEAQANLRAPANALPVTVAPLELLTVAMSGVGSFVPVEVAAGQERRRGGDEVAQLLVVSNPEAPIEHLVRLLDEGVGFVRRCAAAHPKLPREVVDMLLRDGTTSMRAVAASNPAITTETVCKAAHDESAPVRAAAGANPRLPGEDLTRLAGDPDFEVRAGVGRNPAIPSSLAKQLAGDATPEVREGVASNPKAPKQLLAGLAHDADARVCIAIARNTSTPAAALQELSGALPYFVLGNPSTPQGVLTAGAITSDIEMRIQVARNESTPSKAFTRLASDVDRRVLHAVVKNPKAPKSAVRRATSRLEQLDAELKSAARKASLAEIIPAPPS